MLTEVTIIEIQKLFVAMNWCKSPGIRMGLKTFRKFVHKLLRPTPHLVFIWQPLHFHVTAQWHLSLVGPNGRWLAGESIGHFILQPLIRIAFITIILMLFSIIFDRILVRFSDPDNLCDIMHQGHHLFNTLRLRQNGRHFPDDILRCIFLNENVWISINISLEFVLKGPINNIPALVQIMAWGQPGDKPLSEPRMVSLLTHICVTLPQWVKGRLVDLLCPYFYFGAQIMFKPNEYIWKWIMRKFTLFQMVHKLLGFKKCGTHIL